MKRYELVIIGAGPAGLSAAIEAAKNGMKVILFDENSKPGGQLFKQTHKFFGSKEHRAKERGFKIGQTLLKEAEDLGVEVCLQSTVIGIFDNKELSVVINDSIEHVRANSIIIATGASENVVSFPGWTLPGVVGAGAAQTMMNLHGIKPGDKIIMVGSGNVGLVVGYQLLQAGCKLEAVIDAAPRVGGYGVHAAKIARMGVPFYMNHTIKEAYGNESVEGATIVEVNSSWEQIKGSEKHFDVDTICLAVGLSPMSQLAKISGCEMEDNPKKGGWVPVCNKYEETSVPGIFVAGDVAGIEEASSAMIQGKIAGNSVSNLLGYINDTILEERFSLYHNALNQLREGMFGDKDKKGSLIEKTEDGYDLSQNLLLNGYIKETEISCYPGVPDETDRKKGIIPVIECTQNIPCNPCQEVCAKGCIKVGKTITRLPVIDFNVNCTGCGMCVTSCPGQAIFLVNENYEPDYATVSIPYELLPVPSINDIGTALDRSGNELGDAQVINIKKSKIMDKTVMLTMKVPLEWSMKARFFKCKK